MASEKAKDWEFVHTLVYKIVWICTIVTFKGPYKPEGDGDNENEIIGFTYFCFHKPSQNS